MKERADLFGEFEIGGWLCKADDDVYREVARRWPGSRAADDADWQLAQHTGGETEGWPEYILWNDSRLLSAYVAGHPRGVHVVEGVDRAVASLGNLLPRQPGYVGEQDAPIVDSLRRFEEAGARLESKQEARLLRAVLPWWEMVPSAEDAARVSAAIRFLETKPQPP